MKAGMKRNRLKADEKQKATTKAKTTTTAKTTTAAAIITKTCGTSSSTHSE